MVSIFITGCVHLWLNLINKLILSKLWRPLFYFLLSDSTDFSVALWVLSSEYITQHLFYSDNEDRSESTVLSHTLYRLLYVL